MAEVQSANEQMLQTLRSARATMDAQLDRMAKPATLDRERLEVLRREAGQLAGFADVVLAKMTRDGTGNGPRAETIELVRFFGRAQQRAALILKQARKNV